MFPNKTISKKLFTRTADVQPASLRWRDLKRFVKVQGKCAADMPTQKTCFGPRLKPRVFPVAARNNPVAGDLAEGKMVMEVLTNPLGRFGRSPDDSTHLDSVPFLPGTAQIVSCKRGPNYNVVFPAAAFTLAHLALTMLAQHNRPGHGQKWWIAFGAEQGMVD